MKRKKKMVFPAPLFMVLMAVYCELLLYFWVPEEGSPRQFIQVLTFALALGMLLAFVTSLFRGRGSKGCAIFLSVVLAVVYMTQYFIHDAYQCFMTFSTVLSGADGVATDFLSVALSLILRNLWRIGLVLLPVFLYGICFRSRKSRGRVRVLLVLSAVLLYLLGFCAVGWMGVDQAIFRDAYHFGSAVRSFGLHAALVLDMVNGSEASQEEDFVVILPPETEAPAQSPTVRPTDGETQPEETEIPTEPPKVYGDNVLPLDFAALAASEDSSSIAKIHSYVAGLTPSRENEFTGLFEGKNLILITAEAFSAEAIDPELTPTLYRLATQGIQFTDYYQPAWGGSTSTGEYSNLTGLVPTNGINSVKEAVQQDLFLTIGSQLQALGYYSTAYHNHSYTYYDRDSTHTGFGYDKFIGLGNGMEAGVKNLWPESDREMMDFTVQQYVDQQPFSIYYMTVSGHCLYSRSGNSMAKRNYDAVADLDASETIKCYYATQLELEYGMASLVRQLEDAGIADDTVIVLATDHYPYGLEKSSTWNNTEDYLAELYGYDWSGVVERDHSALIIWSGSIEGQNIVVDTPVYSLDILPTLSNLFGVEYDSRLLVGRDVFSDAEPLVLWPNYSWKTDKGTYVSGKFTPAEGVEVEDGYAERISAIVKNKITYSKSVAEKDYFNILAKELGR